MVGRVLLEDGPLGLSVIIELVPNKKYLTKELWINKWFSLALVFRVCRSHHEPLAFIRHSHVFWFKCSSVMFYWLSQKTSMRSEHFCVLFLVYFRNQGVKIRVSKIELNHPLKSGPHLPPSPPPQTFVSYKPGRSRATILMLFVPYMALCFLYSVIPIYIFWFYYLVVVSVVVMRP